MLVIVIHAGIWCSSAEAKALALLHLRWSPDACVMVVGAEEVPEDLAKACLSRRIEHVAAPLHSQPARRFPDVRTSGDSPVLAWSLAVMQRLLELDAQQKLIHVELPSRGALAYALLQERDFLAAFAGMTVSIRFDGLTAIDAVRTGKGIEPRDLLSMDMERICLECSDEVMFDSQAMATAVKDILLPINGHLPLRATWPGMSRENLSDRPVPAGLACLATESGALRQALRAICAYLAVAEDAPRTVFLLCDQAVLQEAQAVLPASLRERFVIGDQAVLEGAPTRVILADSWSSGSSLARDLLSRGHALLINAANPAHASSRDWLHAENFWRYGPAADLLQALRLSAGWQPAERLQARHEHVLQSRCPGATGPATVSVIVPCFNMGRWLPETLACIKRFDWPWLDIIVVDDGSTDTDTRHLLDELESASSDGLRVIRQPFNQGLSAARNAGLAAATGEFTLSLDADDLLSADFVGQAVQALQRCSHYDFVVPRAVYFADQDGPVSTDALPLQQCIPFVGSAFESGVLANRFSTATSLARTVVLRALGYDENLRSYEDWQLYRRALQQGSRFLVTNDIHFYYRQRPESMIHDPQMRARHTRLHAEMMAGPALEGRPLAVPGSLLSVNVVQVLPVPGPDSVMLSGVLEMQQGMAHLRHSRFWRLAYRLWDFLRTIRS